MQKIIQTIIEETRDQLKHINGRIKVEIQLLEAILEFKKLHFETNPTQKRGEKLKAAMEETYESIRKLNEIKLDLTLPLEMKLMDLEDEDD